MTSSSVLSVSIDPAVSSLYPEVAVYSLYVSGLDKANDCLAAGNDALLAKAKEELVQKGLTLERLADSPAIAPWRKAAQNAKLKPSTFKSSVEQLQRRVFKGDFTTPIPAVTAYCIVSAAEGAPLGGYDISKLPVGPMILRMSKPGDSFRPLGGRSVDFPLSDQIPVYAIGSEVLCYQFNVRDSQLTCLETGTHQAIFMGEAIVAYQKPLIQAALKRLGGILMAGGASTSGLFETTANGTQELR